MDTNNKYTSIRLSVKSSPHVHMPSMLTNLMYIYQVGDKEAAVERLIKYFDGTLAENGAQLILSGKVVPIFDIQDLKDNSLSFILELTNVAEQTRRDMNLE